MAPLVMDVIFALEIGGFTSYNAESCKININHSSTYKTTYMKVKKLKKKKKIRSTETTLQCSEHTLEHLPAYEILSSIAIKANMLLCCVNCGQQQSIPKDLNLHLSAHTHKTTYMFVICMHDAPKHKYALKITCDKHEFERIQIVPGTAVAQWLRCCATIRKVAGSIPAGVNGFFIEIKSFRSHYGPGVNSASNKNQCQEYFLGVKAAGAFG